MTTQAPEFFATGSVVENVKTRKQYVVLDDYRRNYTSETRVRVMPVGSIRGAYAIRAEFLIAVPRAEATR